jgi:hypothetical protein
LELNFTNSPSPNQSDIQGRPAASLHQWEIVCSCFVGPDEIGDLVDEIETMLNWHHSDRLVRLSFRFFLHSFSNHLPFSFVLPLFSDANNRMLNEMLGTIV